MLIEWVQQLDHETRTDLAIKDVDEVVRAAEAALDDLAYLRTHHGEVLTVVDGRLDRFAVPLGFTQGGLYSMLCFCIAVCFLVLKPLKEEFPEIAPKCIAVASVSRSRLFVSVGSCADPSCSVCFTTPGGTKDVAGTSCRGSLGSDFLCDSTPA